VPCPREREIFLTAVGSGDIAAIVVVVHHTEAVKFWDCLSLEISLGLVGDIFVVLKKKKKKVRGLPSGSLRAEKKKKKTYVKWNDVNWSSMVVLWCSFELIHVQQHVVIYSVDFTLKVIFEFSKTISIIFLGV